MTTQLNAIKWCPNCSQLMWFYGNFGGVNKFVCPDCATRG